MADVLKFDSETSRILESMYTAPEAVAQRRVVLQMLQLCLAEKVLDIGCGPGFLVKDLARAVGREGKVSAIDISESALALARKRCAEHSCAEFRPAGANYIPYPDAIFDAAVAAQVYEYVVDLSAAFSELYRVLRSGGRAVIIDTDWPTIVWHSTDCARMRHILEAWKEHLIDPVLPRTLAARMRQAGFVVRQASVVSYLNTKYGPDNYSYGLAKLICSFVPGRHEITRQEVDSWAEELQQLDKTGAYFFSLNRYAFLAQKP
jgi:ubiquinone/menaquinone biosynthesis C-methylase UbiE